MPENKARGYLTDTQLEQIKATLNETPDISLNGLIEKLDLSITVSGLCHRLKRNKIPYKEKEQYVFTKEQVAQLRAVFTETPDMPLDDWIAKHDLPITRKQLRRKLISMGVLSKTRTFLTKTQIAQVKAVISETPDIPLNEIIEKLSLQITNGGLRASLRKMGIPYKGQKKQVINGSSEPTDKIQLTPESGHSGKIPDNDAAKPKASIEDRLREAQKKVDAQPINDAPDRRDRNRSLE